jgi:luciferase family oxidoreductase group 1
VAATPGQGANVPLYILGSSLFGATLAAALGLPYAFASHFAPAALWDAAAVYRREFRPSAQLAEPYFIPAMNVIAADAVEDAQAQLREAQRRRARLIFGRGRSLTPEQVEQILGSPARAHVDEMLRHTAVGTAETVKEQIAAFAEQTRADELILAGAAPDKAAKLRTFELVARAHGLAPAA